jgi:hypothetical protein
MSGARGCQWTSLAFFVATAVVPATSAADVAVRGTSLVVDGRPFTVRGAAGQTRLDLLRQLGANTVRTYGNETERVLEEAARHDLKVIAGFWLEHPRRGFDYRDRKAVDAQLASLRAFVQRHKDHPALLAWGLGNEVEAELSDDTVVWPAIEEAARLVKSLDRRHPTMAVLAEAGTDKVRKIKERAPSIDLLGVNSYGDALLSVPDRVRAQGWTGVLVITEMGARGQWQAGKTPWGAALEPTSSEKAELLQRYLAALMPKTQGQLLFFWGQKQEVTPTWHGLLLSSGEWTAAAEAMAKAWGGMTPAGNRAPAIRSFAFDRGAVWPASMTARAKLDANDPDGDPIAVDWTVMAESTDLRKAGDAEATPREHREAVKPSGATSVAVAGLLPGNYRLFVIVRDGKGAAATANLPFQVVN